MMSEIIDMLEKIVKFIHENHHGSKISWWKFAPISYILKSDFLYFGWAFSFSSCLIQWNLGANIAAWKILLRNVWS